MIAIKKNILALVALLGCQSFANALDCTVRWNTENAHRDLVAQLSVNVESGLDVIQFAEIKSLQVDITGKSTKRHGWSRFGLTKSQSVQMINTMAIDDMLTMNKPTKPLYFGIGSSAGKLVDSGVSPVFRLIDGSGNPMMECYAVRDD